MAEAFKDVKIDYVMAPEAIGWILGVSIAKELGVGFIGVRKTGKLPYVDKDIYSIGFTDYSGQQKQFEIASNWGIDGKNILLVDDWIETGSQMNALLKLCKDHNCNVLGIATIGIDMNERFRQWEKDGFLAYIGSDI